MVGENRMKLLDLTLRKIPTATLQKFYDFGYQQYGTDLLNNYYFSVTYQGQKNKYTLYVHHTPAECHIRKVLPITDRTSKDMGYEIISRDEFDAIREKIYQYRDFEKEQRLFDNV
jgi:hypothetical protein